MLCSLRNVHGVVCVDYDTKELKWILSDPAFWQGTPVEDKLLKPEGDIPWFYQQHSAFWMEENLDGNPDTRQMILFDNHWEKRRHAPSFDGDMKHSYISIYSINEKERTVSLWKRFPCRKSKIQRKRYLCGRTDTIVFYGRSFCQEIRRCGRRCV